MGVVVGSSRFVAVLVPVCSEEHPPKQVSDPEEHQDHDRDNQRDQTDHSQKARLFVALVHDPSQHRGASLSRRSQQIGDQIDRAGSEYGASAAGELGCADQGQARVGNDLRRRTSQLGGERL